MLRALGFPDQPGRSAMDALGFVGDRDALVVLDNCEHLVDAFVYCPTRSWARARG